MTIDERLDKLTERHEALTQSVELLMLNQREAFDRYDAWIEKQEAAWERNWARHDEAWARNELAWVSNEQAWARNDEAMAKTQTMLAQMVETMDSLARVAHAH